MMRDLLDSGEIYEPKTIQSAYRIDCPSTFAYLFGLDLENREMVWLNMTRAGNTIVAGETSLAFLMDYFDVAKVMNVYRFFEMMATELVTDPAQADIVVSDRAEIWEKANAVQEGNGINANVAQEAKDADSSARKEWIHSYDFERLMALMNQ
jgi:hypothetical protein